MINASLLVAGQFLIREGHAKKSSWTFISIFILTDLMHFYPEKRTRTGGSENKLLRKKLTQEMINKYGTEDIT